MFRHLDDPAPFWPDEEFRQSVVRRGRHRRLRRRAAAVAGSLAVTLASVGAAGMLYVDRRDAAIDRVDIGDQPSVDGATNILLVGSDVRPEGVDPEVEGARADTIVLLRLTPDGSVTVLGIPRDLVDPATGARVNAFDGDPQALVDTIHRVLGVPIDHYVAVDFAGFVDLVDAVGGVEVAVDVALRDEDSGLDLQPSECVTLDGETALAAVRSRHTSSGDSDFGRIARGQGLLAAALANLAEAADDPVEIDRLTRVLADHAVVDTELSLGRMRLLGEHLAAAGPGRTHFVTLPVVSDEGANGASILRVPQEAGMLLEQFGAPPGSGQPPPDDGILSQVTVGVGTPAFRPCD